MRKALIVGIDYYVHFSRLFGCVNDSYEVKNILERNSDGTINFGIKHLFSHSDHDLVTKEELRTALKDLFCDDNSISLFYFAGHGSPESSSGYLMASDSNSPNDGIPLDEIMHMVNKSPAKNKIIILDSCFSGAAANSPINPKVSEIAEGVTILTACSPTQYASESHGSGVFTTLFVDALRGAACNLVGEISPGSIYSYIDQSLGAWAQRPVFKTNVKSFVSLREVQAPIPLELLQKMKDFFPEPGFEFKLDPTFEPERNGGEPEGTPSPIQENIDKFAILQKYNRVNLLVPVDAPHMWHAAMNSKSCKLTVLGEHYRRLSEEGLI